MMKYIRVCNGKKCGPAGSGSIMQAIERAFGVRSGQQNDEIDLDFCACTGNCEQAPNVRVGGRHIIHHANRDTVVKKIQNNEVDEIKKILIDENFLGDNFLGDL